MKGAFLTLLIIEEGDRRPLARATNTNLPTPHGTGWRGYKDRVGGVNGTPVKLTSFRSFNTRHFETSK